MRSTPPLHSTPPPWPSHAPLAAAGVAAALALLIASLSCERNIASTLLTPTGDRPMPAIGVLRGKLDFGTPGTFPKTLVMIARNKAPSCISDYTTIQVVGTPTGFNIAQSPYLTKIVPCFWMDTLSIPLGTLEWKFVTNGAFDNPPDYGRPGSQNDGLIGTALKGAPGPDGNLNATVGANEAGSVLCTLDETVQPAPYAFQKLPVPGLATYSSTLDGSFVLSGLIPGSYNVIIRSPAGTRTFNNVTVGTATTDLGTVALASFTITASAGTGGTISPSGAVAVTSGQSQAFAITPDAGFAIADVLVDGGSVGAVASYTFTNVVANHTIAASFSSTGPLTGGISGTLIYDPTSDPDLTGPPWPPATVELFRGATKVGQVTNPKSSNTYGFSNLAAGSYKLRWDAWQFVRDSMSLSVGTTVVTQDITLAADVSELSSNMHCAGDFNSFTIADSTQMSLIFLGLWEYTPSHPIAAGTYNMKFVTDGVFDLPTDYGGDQSVTITAPVTDADCSLVSGVGTALRIQIPTAGIYRFRIDERRLTFSVESVP